MDWEQIETWLALQRGGFCNGWVLVTPQARALCQRAEVSPYTLLSRHVGAQLPAHGVETFTVDRALMPPDEAIVSINKGLVLSSHPLGADHVVVETDRKAGRTRILAVDEWTQSSIGVRESGIR